MRILKASSFSIYVYPNDHPPPHCHVRFKSGKDISVDVPLIEPRFDEELETEVRRAIKENLDSICSAWDNLNPNKEAHL